MLAEAFHGSIFDLDPSDGATDSSIATADGITEMRFVLTYSESAGEHRLFWSANGADLAEHPNSPLAIQRIADTTEFQWQVWDLGTANPSAFSVGLDNYVEYDVILTTGGSTAVENWLMY